MRWLVVVAFVVACGPQRTLEVGDVPLPLDEARTHTYDWSNSSSLGLSPTGSETFPSTMTIRLRVWDQCGDNDECDQDLASGSVKPVSGSPCVVTIPTSCSGTTCLTELRIDALGNCLLAVHAKLTSGDDESTCWYRAVYEADDPYDDVMFAKLESKTDGEVERCNDEL